jgi:response regulator of citrate/malate metabolism
VDYEGALEALTHEGIVSYLAKEVEKMQHALCHYVSKGAMAKTIDSRTSDQIIKYHHRWQADFIRHAVCIVPGIPANKFHIILCWMHHDLYKEWSHQVFSPPPMTEDVSDKIIHE